MLTTTAIATTTGNRMGQVYLRHVPFGKNQLESVITPMPDRGASANLAVGMDDEKMCRLEGVAGRTVACPEGGCAFWEPGGAVLEGRCVLHEIDFAREPGLAEWLLELRESLARGADRGR